MPNPIDKKFIAAYAAKLIADDARKTAYVKSKPFKERLDIIQRHHCITQDDLINGRTSIDGLTASGFQKVCEAVFHTTPLIKEEQSSFPKYHADYEGVRFHLLIGQGSTYWTTVEKKR